MHHTSHKNRREERESPINMGKSIDLDYADGSPKTVEDACARSVRAGRWRLYSAAGNYYTPRSGCSSLWDAGRWRYGFNVYCWLTVVCMRPRSFVARLVPLNCPHRQRHHSSTPPICHLSPVAVFVKTSASAGRRICSHRRHYHRYIIYQRCDEATRSVICKNRCKRRVQCRDHFDVIVWSLNCANCEYKCEIVPRYKSQ